MSIKDLDDYEESGLNNPKYFDSPDQQKSIKEEKREHAIRMEEEKTLNLKNFQKKYTWIIIWNGT